jgi:hypothetical protein
MPPREVLHRYGRKRKQRAPRETTTALLRKIRQSGNVCNDVRVNHNASQGKCPLPTFSTMQACRKRQQVETQALHTAVTIDEGADRKENEM